MVGGGVDGQGLDRPCFPGLQVDRAVNVDALTPTLVCSIASFSWLGAQQPTGPRRMGRMRRITANSTASSSPKEFSSFS